MLFFFVVVLIFLLFWFLLASASPPVFPAKDIKFTNETINNNLKTATDASKVFPSQPSNDLPENVKDISSEKYYLSPVENQRLKENEQNTSTIPSPFKGIIQFMNSFTFSP